MLAEADKLGELTVPTRAVPRLRRLFLWDRKTTGRSELRGLTGLRHVRLATAGAVTNRDALPGVTVETTPRSRYGRDR
ncbi:hypothetical protein [Streptomyces sp. 7-21]|uniref:hypothetical protein n=1 Tax=Streptomyces sp. 7-21 TaxID=2802283 RepID=UPI00191FB18C|nr:hypothetical protein [Streptomyces sp. 7-21]MBL1068615.1 hypothetical protein [Streptomyces sp. 7-21]